jgi:Fic family protein
MNQITSRQNQILDIVQLNPGLSPKFLQSQISPPISLVTLSRDLSRLVSLGYLNRTGSGPSTTYSLTTYAHFFRQINYQNYFSIEPDKRHILDHFNFDIFDSLSHIQVFSHSELTNLKQLKAKYQHDYSQLSKTIINKEIERVTIELSWKSSVIEGNTYNLLDTENLLKQGIEAKGKKKEETVMLLNHKAAIDFIFTHPKTFQTINIPKIEHLHQIITRNLSVTSNIRKTLIGITGTKYQPIDNQFQIEDALRQACHLINSLKDPFTKSLLAILLLSYIQPFEDGNKRASRILGNAVLLANNCFPIPLRSVDENLYKQATLLFYEQNNLELFKSIFIEQCHFSVENYFRL